jgi:hypothetical protein
MAGECHDLTHVIGASAYQEFARGRKVAASAKMAYCSYGFYHGFMEALVSAQRDTSDARKFCAEVDRQLALITPDATLQCFHGIGHGTVNNHNPATWGDEGAMIDPALALCEKAAGNTEELSRCATGVFNGIATFYLAGQYNLTPNSTDPLWICRTYNDTYKDACYISMNIVLLSLTNGDLGQAAAFLAPIPDEAMAAHAVINLAAILAQEGDARDSAEVFQTCRSLAARLRIPCVQGYAYGFLEHGKPGVEYEIPLALCGATALTVQEQEGCFTYIFGYLKQWYGRDKVAAICAGIAQKDRAKQCEMIALNDNYEQ